MVEQAVGGEILVDRVEMGRFLERLAGAADARGGVDVDRVGIDQAEQRLQREDRRGRVAAGRRDRLDAGDRVAVELGNAVDEAADQVRARDAARCTSARRRRRRRAGNRRRDRRTGCRARGSRGAIACDWPWGRAAKTRPIPSSASGAIRARCAASGIGQREVRMDVAERPRRPGCRRTDGSARSAGWPAQSRSSSAADETRRRQGWRRRSCASLCNYLHNYASPCAQEKRPGGEYRGAFSRTRTGLTGCWVRRRSAAR